MAHAVACVRQWVEMQLRAPIGHTSVSAATPDSSYAISACACLEPLDAQSQPLAHIAGGTAQRASSRLLQLHTRGLTYNVGLPGQFLAGVFPVAEVLAMCAGAHKVSWMPLVKWCTSQYPMGMGQATHSTLGRAHGGSFCATILHEPPSASGLSPALASPDSARSSRTTRGWGERRGAGDALAEIDAVDGSAENRNRRARRGRAAQSPHPVPGERSATVRGHKPHRQRHTVSHGRGRATLHLQHPSVTHRASVVRDIRYRRHPAAVGVRFASLRIRPIHGAPPRPRDARGATSPTSKSRRVTEL